MNTLIEKYMIECAFETDQARTANREYQPMHLSERDIIETFGREGIKIAKEQLALKEAEIKDIEGRMIAYLEQLYRNKWQISQKDFIAEIARELFSRQIKEREVNIKRLERLLACAKRKDNPGEITASDVASAKEVPIDDYVLFNHARMAPCLWHSEKTGSMHYYPRTNRIKCFGCGMSGDVVDVVQKLNDISFLEAVKIVLNK